MRHGPGSTEPRPCKTEVALSSATYEKVDRGQAQMVPLKDYSPADPSSFGFQSQRW